MLWFLLLTSPAHVLGTAAPEPLMQSVAAVLLHPPFSEPPAYVKEPSLKPFMKTIVITPNFNFSTILIHLTPAHVPHFS